MDPMITLWVLPAGLCDSVNERSPRIQDIRKTMKLAHLADTVVLETRLGRHLVKGRDHGLGKNTHVVFDGESILFDEDHPPSNVDCGKITAMTLAIQPRQGFTTEPSQGDRTMAEGFKTEPIEADPCRSTIGATIDSPTATRMKPCFGTYSDDKRDCDTCDHEIRCVATTPHDRGCKQSLPKPGVIIEADYVQHEIRVLATMLMVQDDAETKIIAAVDDGPKGFFELAKHSPDAQNILLRFQKLGHVRFDVRSNRYCITNVGMLIAGDLRRRHPGVRMTLSEYRRNFVAPMYEAMENQPDLRELKKTAEQWSDYVEESIK